MHRKGQTALSFLVVAVYASFGVFSPVRAGEPMAAAPQLADGVWRVEGQPSPAPAVVVGRLG